MIIVSADRDLFEVPKALKHIASSVEPPYIPTSLADHQARLAAEAEAAQQPPTDESLVEPKNRFGG